MTTIANIILPIPLEKAFTYHIPDELQGMIRIGQRVLVPFGPNEEIGFVHTITEQKETQKLNTLALEASNSRPKGSSKNSNIKDTQKLKDIINIIDKEPLLNDELLKLGKWMSEYYACSFGEALWQLLPKKHSVRPTKNKTTPSFSLKPFLKLTPDQSKAFDAISNSIHKNKQARACAKNHTQTQFSKPDINSNSHLSVNFKTPRYQENFLLFGVAGSGKTEVYLHAMRETLALDKQVIYLIPEISLTPQTVSRLIERFGNDVVVWHSHMTDRQRYLAWHRMNKGEGRIAIGPRSAILAPLKNIGLIVIDEEQEDSYKQDQKPCYDARMVAKWRAEYHNAVLVIGSATPRIETYDYFNIDTEKRLSLPLTISDSLQETASQNIHVRVIDMRKELERRNLSIFSHILQKSIDIRLSKKEQVILFLNRRGHDTFVFCRKCGFVMQCPHCDISLVYHSDKEHLLCHYCGFTAPNPSTCPDCKSGYIKYFGSGIQKVEKEVLRLFPNARVARLDLDTTKKKGYIEDVYTQFHDKKIDILIGTQIVAKGHDFPGVTLVGIISADTALNLPDFRASERTFSLIMQAAGRGGRRGDHSEVVIQTYYPDHYAIKTSSQSDYEAFYNEELSWRKKLDYPPFSHLVNITLRGKNNDAVHSESVKLFNHIKPEITAKNIEIIGPFHSLVPKRYGNYRWQIVIKEKIKEHASSSRHEWLDLIKSYRTTRGIKLSIDVDPVSML